MSSYVTICICIIYWILTRIISTKSEQYYISTSVRVHLQICVDNFCFNSLTNRQSDSHNTEFCFKLNLEILFLKLLHVLTLFIFLQSCTFVSNCLIYHSNNGGSIFFYDHETRHANNIETNFFPDKKDMTIFVGILLYLK